ncbi:hypothetical protein HDU97_004186 [Phlyctochytrium planicorne]|nr:hypothetical protein HDU97_004186 [Phlyctochytrium planicorne]
MARWWAWRDAVLTAATKEEEVKKENRRRFLSKLRTHPWVDHETSNSPAAPSPNSPASVQNVPAIEPAQHRSSPALTIKHPESHPRAPTQPRPIDMKSQTPATASSNSEVSARTVRALAVQRLRAARGERERDRSVEVLLRVEGDDGGSPAEKVPSPFEKHRTATVGIHAGALVSNADVPSGWRRGNDAHRKLIESRRQVRSEIDMMLRRANAKIESMQSVEDTVESISPQQQSDDGWRRSVSTNALACQRTQSKLTTTCDAGEGGSSPRHNEPHSKAKPVDIYQGQDKKQQPTGQKSSVEILLTMRRRMLAQQKALNSYPPEDAVNIELATTSHNEAMIPPVAGIAASTA